MPENKNIGNIASETEERLCQDFMNVVAAAPMAPNALATNIAAGRQHKAQSDFERDGLAGLLPGKRGPRGPHKVTAEVMDFVARALTKDPSLDGATLAERVEQQLGLRVHPRTIERALARAKKKRS